MSRALLSLGRQAKISIAAPRDVTRGKTGNAVNGEMSVRDALSQLLSGSGLQFTFVNGSAVRISRAVLGEARTSTAVAESAASQSLPTDGGEAAEIVVVGTNIKGNYPASSPVEIYDAVEIRRSGATTTEQFIQKLPQNLGTRTQYAANATSALNPEGVNSVDLRGLGVGTTLVLLNGRRLGQANFGQAVDISLIPLSAIERVEVLTDGASAIYGSDAIGGVVNFVLRDDFEGLETQVRYGGVTDGNLQQGGGTVTFGQQWGSGRALASYDYHAASSLRTTDRDYAAAAGPGTLSPRDRRHSGLFSLSQDFSESFRLSFDAAYSVRDTRNETSFLTVPSFQSFTVNTSSTRQLFANAGLEYDVSDAISLSLLGTYSRARVKSKNVTDYPQFGFSSEADIGSRNSVAEITAKVGGRLFSLPAGPIQFSAGGGYIGERYRGEVSSSGALSGSQLSRSVYYGFGELLLPLLGPAQAIPFASRLDLSVAARYTKYEGNGDFGGRLSPKVGLVWVPINNIKFRGTYGESFRAPFLNELDSATSTNALFFFPVAGTNSLVLNLNGPSPDLRPERAKSYTIGADFTPTRRTKLSVTYFNIDYKSKIAVGDPSGGILPASNPGAFPDVIYQANAAQIAQLLRSTTNTYNESGVDLSDPDVAASALAGLSNFWITDLRLRNLSLSKVSGIDVGGSIDFRMFGAQATAGAQVTKILKYREQITPNSPVLSVEDVVLQPADLRGRSYLTLSGKRLSATISANHVDSYVNPYPVTGAEKIGSWTTVDLNASYDFGAGASGPMKNLRIDVSVQNLFDKDPPFVSLGTNEGLRNPVGFDPANANPLGRLIVLSLIKAW
jgi:outer membrane receptor protein involved in Fe transport